MRHWERHLETLARRLTALVWWVFDLTSLLVLVALPYDGLLRGAESASSLLLIACALLLWRETSRAALA